MLSIVESLNTPSLGQAQTLKQMCQENKWNSEKVKDILYKDKPNQKEKLSFTFDEIDN